nr:hypothetical protein [Gammaproteobacteria bacterium]
MLISASYFLSVSLIFLSHGLAAQDTPTNERELEEQASQLQINPADSIGPMTNELERGTLSSDVLRGLVDENKQERLRIEPSNEPGNERRLNIAAIRQHAGHNAVVFKHTAAGNQSSITPGADFVAMSPGDIVAIESVGEEFKVERDGDLVATTSATKLLVLEGDGSYRNLRLFHVSEGLGWNREFS